jgi:hypothetical protein
MSVWDWLTIVGVVVIAAFLVKAFWRSGTIDPIEQPDNSMGGSDGGSSGGDG